MFFSTFQDKFYFQGLFKTVLYIQVLFKPVRALSSLSANEPIYGFTVYKTFQFNDGIVSAVHFKSMVGHFVNKTIFIGETSVRI